MEKVKEILGKYLDLLNVIDIEQGPVVLSGDRNAIFDVDAIVGSKSSYSTKIRLGTSVFLEKVENKPVMFGFEEGVDFEKAHSILETFYSENYEKLIRESDKSKLKKELEELEIRRESILKILSEN